MMELFAYGTIGFWGLLAAEILLLLVFENFKQGIAATISVVAYLGFLQYFAKVDVLTYAMTHWYFVAVLAGVYLVFGVGWGVFMWRRLVIQRLEKYNDLYQQYLIDIGLPTDTKVLPEDKRQGWVRVVEGTKNYNTRETVADTPQVRHYKAEVIRWMTLWVFSLMLYMFKDLVADLFKKIYRRIASFLQRIADDLWPKGDIAENLKVPASTTTNQNTGRNRNDSGWNT